VPSSWHTTTAFVSLVTLLVPSHEYALSFGNLHFISKIRLSYFQCMGEKRRKSNSSNNILINNQFLHHYKSTWFYGIPLIFFFLFTSISSSIGVIMVPSFVTRGGFTNVRCAVSGIHVFPIGARILASKSFTLVKGNGNSLT